MSRRHGLFALLMVLLAPVVVSITAGVPWSAPWQPAQRQVLDAETFQPVIGSAMADRDGMTVGAVGIERVALQVRPLEQPIAAADFPILRYRFERFPRTLELSLVFRRDDNADDVQVVSLPWPGDGEMTLNLTDVPEWRGRITELGFSQQATPQLIPAGIPFEPFRFVEAQLWAASWHGGLAALASDWTAYRPWGFFSVSSVDQDAGVSLPRRPALLWLVEIGIVATVIIALLLFGWRVQATRRAIAIVLVLGWLLLDALWLAQLYERRATTRLVYAGLDWPQREARVPDDELQAAAARIRAVVADAGQGSRVLIHAASPVEMNRLQYLSLPVNVGLLVYAIDPMAFRFPAGTLLVLYGMDDWYYDATTRSVRKDLLNFPSDPVIDEGRLRIFRIHDAEAG